MWYCAVVVVAATAAAAVVTASFAAAAGAAAAASFSCNAVRVESLRASGVSSGASSGYDAWAWASSVYDASTSVCDASTSSGQQLAWALARAGASTTPDLRACSDSCGIRLQRLKKGRLSRMKW